MNRREPYDYDCPICGLEDECACWFGDDDSDVPLTEADLDAD